MKPLLLFFALLLATAGCVSKKEMQEKQRAAFMAGQQQGEAAAKASANSVLVVGNVRNPSIPWREDLSLRQVLIEANYQGSSDPRQIIVYRGGAQPIVVNPQELLQGNDMPMLAGDRVEIR